MDGPHISKAVESAPASTSPDSKFFSSESTRAHELTCFTYQNASFFNGHFKLIASETTGKPQQEWINEIPNDGLIRYTALFNRERLLITNSRALGEVLVQKNYDFIKPDQLRQGLGRLLGIGVLLAEGEEHKVRRDMQS